MLCLLCLCISIWQIIFMAIIKRTKNNNKQTKKIYKGLNSDGQHNMVSYVYKREMSYRLKAVRLLEC